MSESTQAKFSWVFIGAVFFVCVIPAILHAIGLSFAMPLDLGSVSNISVKGAEHSLGRHGGAFILTILQWSAVAISLFIAMLAFAHFNIARDVATPIIGIAFLFLGLIDGYQTLVANRLLAAKVGNATFIPFAWAVSRMLYAVIMLLGVGIALFRGAAHQKSDLRVIPVASVVFGALAFGVVYYLSNVPELPISIYPERLITRPYDVLPLVLFIVAGLFIFPTFYRRMPSYFSHGLVISIIPEVATQLYLVFGSGALYDNHFITAYFLKVVACLVPLTGLAADYVRSHSLRSALEKEVSRSRDDLRAVLQAVAEPVVVMNDQLVIVMMNQEVTRIWGHKRSAVIGQTLDLLVKAEDQSDPEELRQLKKNLLSKLGRKLMLTGRRTNGQTFPLELRLSKARVGARLLFIATVRESSHERIMSDELSGARRWLTLLRHVASEVCVPLDAGLSRAAKATPPDAERLKAFVGAIEGVRQRLGDALQLVDMRKRSDSPSVSAFQLTDLLQQTTQEAHDCGLTLVTRIDGDVPPVVSGDFARVFQVLRQLVRVVAQDSRLGSPLLNVKTGAGVVMFELVDPRRENDARRQRLQLVSEGGLPTIEELNAALAVRTLTLLDSSLAVTATDLGGISLSFLLPLSAASEAAEVRKPGLKPAVQLPGGLQILLADSSADRLLLLEQAFADAGHVLKTARTAREAVAQLQAREFDVLLFNMALPDLDCLTAIGQIREWEIAQERRPVSVIVIRPETAPEKSAQLLERGVDFVLTGQAEAESLSDALVSCLQARDRNVEPGVVANPSELESQSATVPAGQVVSARTKLAVEVSGGLSAAETDKTPIQIEVDPDFADLVPQYLENRIKDVKTLLACLESDDFSQIKTLGHKMKGSGAGYGFPVISVIGGEIEAAANARDSITVRKQASRLENYVLRVELLFPEQAE